MGLVGTYRDDRHPAGGDGVADHLEVQVREALDGQNEAARLERLVQDPHGVGIAQLATGQAHEHRIAVVDDADSLAAAGRERVQHDGAYDRDDGRVERRAQPHDLIDRGLALLAALNVDIGVVRDQARRPADLGHDRVAGVDAEPALDASEVGPVADVDTGGADVDALIAIDAVAGPLAARAQSRALLDRAARLAPVVAIGDVEGLLVGERGLDAWPRAHIETDLLAHVAGERVGREGENADPQVGDERRLEGRELLHQRWRVGEVEHPGAAGPPRHHEPEEMLEPATRKAIGRPRLLVAEEMLAPVTFGPALDGLEQIGPHRLWTEIAAPDPPGDRVHQEQRHRRQDQQPGEVVDLLRPDLDEEEVESPIGKIDQHGLVGRVETAVPAYEWKPVVDTERDQQHDPLDAAVGALHALGIDLPPRRIE